MNDIAVIEPLNAVERDTLQRHEQTITDGLNVFWRVGEALQAIRDGRLYRETHRTFADYCKAKWSFSDSRSRQLRAAAETYKALLESLPSVAEVELTERAMRALDQFPVEYHPVIIDTSKSVAKTLNKGVSSGVVTRVGQVITQAAQTGVVDTGNGESTPLTAALVVEEYEAEQRAKQHMSASRETKFNTVIPFMSAAVISIDPVSERLTLQVSTAVLMLSQLAAGDVVRLTVAVEKIQEAA